MKLTFQFTNTTATEYPTVIIDTDNKIFSYFTIEVTLPDSIRVMRKEDFNSLMDKINDNGYALKIGGIK